MTAKSKIPHLGLQPGLLWAGLYDTLLPPVHTFRLSFPRGCQHTCFSVTKLTSGCDGFIVNYCECSLNLWHRPGQSVMTDLLPTPRKVISCWGHLCHLWEPPWRWIKNKADRWAVVARAFNPSTREAETGGALWVRGQPGLQTKFQS